MSGNIRGIQHLGLPTADMDRTVAFYERLGFAVAYRTLHNSLPVCFLQGNGITVEAYQTDGATGRAGAIDHLALDVADIGEALQTVTSLGLAPLKGGVRSLPFWERGVRYFTVEGPNAEKIEFSQQL